MRLVRSGFIFILVSLFLWFLIGFIAIGFWDITSPPVDLAWWLMGNGTRLLRRLGLFTLDVIAPVGLSTNGLRASWETLFTHYQTAVQFPGISPASPMAPFGWSPHFTWAYMGLLFWPLIIGWILLLIISLILRLLSPSPRTHTQGGAVAMDQQGGGSRGAGVAKALALIAVAIVGFWALTHFYNDHQTAQNDQPLSQATQQFTFLGHVGFETPACVAASTIPEAQTHDDSRNLIECARTLATTLSQNTTVDSGLIIRPQDYVAVTTFVNSVIDQNDLLPGLSMSEHQSLKALGVSWEKNHQTRVSAANETVVFLYGQWRLDQQSGKDTATRHEIESSLNYACSRLPQGTTKSGDEAGYKVAQQRCNQFASDLEPTSIWPRLALAVVVIAVVVAAAAYAWHVYRMHDPGIFG